MRPPVELIVALLAGATVLAVLARRIRVPYPIVLVLAGAAAAAVPGLATVRVDPNVVFLVFLPPLLYAGALTTSAAELRHHAGPILTSAVGLVLVTVAAVAAVAHLVTGLGWPICLALGAILGATDPVAAVAVIRRLGAPDRIATQLEGEALVNDGTALTAFKVAVGGITAGSVPLAHDLGRFVLISAGGVAIGAAVAGVAALVRSRLDDPDLETTVGLLTAYTAYVAADRAGCSGVLGAVAAGVVATVTAGTVLTPGARLRSGAFWSVVEFVVGALLFLLIGLQLRSVLDGITGLSAGTLVADAAAVIAAVVAVRMAWMVVAARIAGTGWRDGVVSGWSGLRGALSVAAALSLPATAGGHPVAGRSLVVFLAFAATVALLVVPGLTLAPLIRALGLGQDAATARAERTVRLGLLHAALVRLEHEAVAGEVSERVLLGLREALEAQIAVLARDDDGERGGDGNRVAADGHRALAAERRLRAALLDAQRTALRAAAAERRAPAEVLRELQRELDLEAARLPAGDYPSRP